MPRSLTYVLLAALLTTAFQVKAQDADSQVSTNDLMQADDAGGTDPLQANDTSEEVTGTNVVSESNPVTTPGPDGRARRQRRRWPSRQRDSSGSRDGRSGSGDTNSSPTSLDYSAFRLVADRNIFDPNRAPRNTVRPSTERKTVDAFTLVGTMSYEKGIFAFFDGTSSDYKKAVKPEETIAGYKVSAISADSVKLTQSTNVVELSVGTQMRRQENGTWERSNKSESYGATAANAAASQSAPSSAPSGAESDVLKRMMMRREKE
jgi:hypothetical protein